MIKTHTAFCHSVLPFLLGASLLLSGCEAPKRQGVASQSTSELTLAAREAE